MIIATGGALLVGISACGSVEPTADEALVCSTLQEMVDHLAAQQSQQAIETLVSLKVAVDATRNDSLASAGHQWFDDLRIDQGVDPSQMTMREWQAAGEAAAQQTSRSLGRIIDECNAAGAELERLPQG